jgi:hypothetical protein
MNDSDRSSDDNGRFMSVDCVDFWLDGAGDNTVRPIPPERLERAKAERAKILEAQAAASQSQQQNGKQP